MRQMEVIECDRYYHIYNRGINGENIFYSNENYLYFLKLYDKYINSIADTFAWCLLKNHFHLLVKIKTEKEILEFSNIDLKKLSKKPSQQFSHFFNAYAQAINKQNNRHGSLFEKPFRNKKFLETDYPRGRAIGEFRQFHFGLRVKNRNFVFSLTRNCEKQFRPLPRRGKSEIPRQSLGEFFSIKNFNEYTWSSFQSIVSSKKTKLQRNEVLKWFDGSTNFIDTHPKS